MVSVQELREYMRDRAADDRSRRSVQVTADSIETALNEAAVELDLPVKKLEYEVLERGSRGIFGVNKKNFILIVYEATQDQDENSEDDDLGIDFDLVGAVERNNPDVDGDAVVRLSVDGALLRVRSPQGKGKKATEDQALAMLESRGVDQFDGSMVTKVVKQADGQFIRVGEFSYNPANDSIMAISITDREMKAYMVVHAPGPGGVDQSVETMIAFLKNNDVIHGIQEDALTEFETAPRFEESILVAEGTYPKDGKDAKILYNFEFDRSKIKLKEKNGKVDFKEMNLVQNVVEGQILAKKVQREQGSAGRTVSGKLLPAKDGKDVEIGAGKNVELSDDRMSVKSTLNGQVILNAGKINVEPIYVVQGDVNLKTGGNVIFLGTVFVKGSVADGFKVKASGNIEIMGNVGKAVLDAEGDIIVHQGITGKNGGNIHSGKSVWAKFIENAQVEAAEHVVASDGIINSHVIANGKIVCQGKRATIVGGDLKAAEEIHAKALGSVAGSETILEVGYDPRSKEKLAKLEEKIGKLENGLDEINLNIHTIENLKKVKRELPEEKAQFLEEMCQKKEDTLVQKQTFKDEAAKIKEYLSSLKIRGKIGASAKVFPGVRIYIKDAFLEVRNEFSAVTFINEANLVKITKYEELEERLVRKR
ncbi:MAG: polymerase [Spirochaetales bacterium]|nr:polymerase [Spirochaetales bacterium]